VGVYGGGSGTTIGGTTAEARNIISGNGEAGVLIGNSDGTSGIIIEGNYIGTDVTGQLARGNSGNNGWTGAAPGVWFLGSGANTLGGIAPGSGNVISGNGIGVLLSNGTTGVQIQGNSIGVNAAGTAPLGNGTGVMIGLDSYTYHYLPSNMNNMIGGTAPGAGNLISGNTGAGIVISGYHADAGSVPTGNVVEGNAIGTDASGSAPLGNGGAGVVLANGAASNVIGGTAPGAGNTIAYNGGGGVQIGPNLEPWPSQALLPTGNSVLGNAIRQNAGSGVLVDASGNAVGGTAAGAGNVISGNQGDGVFVGQGATGVSILGNAIAASGGLGIHLDSASRANDSQAAPVLTSASSTGSGTTASGTLASVASTTFRIEFFSNTGLDTSANAEGLTYLGFAQVTTDASGYLASSPDGSAVLTNPDTASATFTASKLAAIPAGQGYLTATATNLNTGDTSQLSNYLTAPTSTLLTSSAEPSLLNQPVTLTATVSSAFGTPAGGVHFVDTTTGTDLGTVALSSGGTASVTVANLAVGSHVIVATYAGQGLFLGSSGTFTQQVDYHFSGFLPPLSNGLQFGLNRTISIKFQLTDFSGNPVTALSAVTSLLVAPVVNGVAGTPFSPASAGNAGLQSSGGQYTFTWQTKGLAAGTYQIQLTLADGTLQTKTLTLTANGNGSSGLVANGTTGSTAGATAGGLLGGDLTLYVDNSAGNLTSDELAALAAAVGVVDGTINPYGVNVTETTDPTAADVVVSLASTTALGGAANGVLGCESDGQITLVSGWSWYAGTDPTQVGAGQYDFETVFVHELGHALGLGHSADTTSVMYASLTAGTTDRALTAADLNVADTASGACGLHVALPANLVPGADSSSGIAVLPAAVVTPAPAVAPAPTGGPAGAADVRPQAAGLLVSLPGLQGAPLPVSLAGTAPAWTTPVVLAVAGAGSPWQTAGAHVPASDGPGEDGWGFFPATAFPAGPVPQLELAPPDQPPAGDQPGPAAAGDGSAAASPDTDGDGGWFLSRLDDRGGQDEGLPAASEAVIQDTGTDPDEARAALAAVFDHETW
jgi:hypothetical protein